MIAVSTSGMLKKEAISDRQCFPDQRESKVGVMVAKFLNLPKFILVNAQNILTDNGDYFK